MRNKLKYCMVALAAAILCTALPAQENYRFDHGPYLQGLTADGVYVYFTTSAEGFSRVELREKGTERAKTFVTVDDGLIAAYNTMNAIRLDGLKPASEYEYRLISKEVAEFRPYKITYGDSISSRWYSFRTPDPSAKSCSFIAMGDIHDDAGKYRRLLSLMPVADVGAVFLVGDIMSHFSRPGQPYDSFIDVSVEEFATGAPFVIVRGNHETRGHLARTYSDFVHRPGGHYYGTYSLGDTFIVMLDSGEDKADDFPVYAGMNDFDGYRREQAQWLKRVVESREFRTAARRIVMVHVPPLVGAIEWEEERYTAHGPREVRELFLPVLNGTGIGLMICGHTHKQFTIEPEKGLHDFPIVVNDNRSASAVTCSAAGIRVRTVNTDGETTLDRVF